MHQLQHAERHLERRLDEPVLDVAWHLLLSMLQEAGNGRVNAALCVLQQEI